MIPGELIRANSSRTKEVAMSPVAESLHKAITHHQAGDLEQAETLYHEIIRRDPGHSDALHLLGVASHQRRRNEDAVNYINRAIEINGSAPLYYSNLGASYSALDKIEEAAASFRRAVEIEPGFAGAHYNLGMALEAMGQFEDAVSCYWTAIQHDPVFCEAYNNLGNIFSSQGRYDEAITCYSKIVEIRPHWGEMFYNLGNALFGNNQLEQAEQAYREALRLNSCMADAHNNLGSVLRDLGRYDEAIECFQAALEEDPGHHEARCNVQSQAPIDNTNSIRMGRLRQAVKLNPDDSRSQSALADMLREQGRYDEAHEHYTEAITNDPQSIDAHFGLGYVYLSDGRHEQAKEYFEQVLRVDPDHKPTLTNLGSLFTTSGEFDRAAECYQRILAVEPESAAAHYNLGNVYKDQQKLEEAASCYRRALELDSHLAEAHVNLGVVLKNLGHVSDAVTSHHRAVLIRPDDAVAHFHYALALLHEADLAQGWDEYEWRWKYEASPREFPYAVWDGASLDDVHLLAYGEQGVGDEIMFASCLPDILEKTAACTLECDPRLVPLFARSFPLANVVAREFDPASQTNGRPAIDVQIAMGSLPRYLRANRDSFPARLRYLSADAAQTDLWRRRYSEIGSGLKVGISWRGGAKPDVRRLRSTSLEKWMPLLSTPGVQFVNVQYGETADELAAIRDRTGVTIHDWDDADPLVDLDNFAAQVAALDLVISVDNSTVHMAAAVGRPVWTLLPFSPNWRWMLEEERSPWYSTMRLFRQPSLNDWPAVFEKVARELKTLSTAPRDHVAPLAAKTADSTQTRPNRPAIETLPHREAHPVEERATHRSADAVAAREKAKYEHIWNHAAYRDHTPGYHDMDKVPLIEALRKHGVHSVLDAGCGTGKLIQRFMTDYSNEFSIHGFDISENCLNPFFDAVKDEVLTVGCLWDENDFSTEYDAIICSDVMEHIPTDKVPLVIKNFKNCTRKICYLAIALVPDNFGPSILGEPLHLTVKEPGWWFSQMALAGFAVESYAVEKADDGIDIRLHMFATLPANTRQP